MEQNSFRELLAECVQMPGDGDSVYRSARNELIAEMGGVFTYPAPPAVAARMRDALAEDRGREWSRDDETPMDKRLAAFAELYLECNAWTRGEIQKSFKGEELRQLWVFSVRAARFAVSRQNMRWLRLGLAGVAIEGARYDFRDSYVALSVLRFAASKMGTEAGRLFDETRALNPGISTALDAVLAYSPGQIKSWVRQFGPPEWASEVKPWWRFW